MADSNPPTATAAAPQTETALVRVVNEQGACFASVFGVTATKGTGLGWSFKASDLAGVLSHLNDTRRLEVRTTNAKGKHTVWAAGKPTNPDDETVILEMRKA